jgi:hypothetical protein
MNPLDHGINLDNQNNDQFVNVPTVESGPRILDFKEDQGLFTNPRVIILASNSDDLVNKWLCVINYFITS